MGGPENSASLDPEGASAEGRRNRLSSFASVTVKGAEKSKITNEIWGFLLKLKNVRGA